MRAVDDGCFLLVLVI